MIWQNCKERKALVYAGHFIMGSLDLIRRALQ